MEARDHGPAVEAGARAADLAPTGATGPFYEGLQGSAEWMPLRIWGWEVGPLQVTNILGRSVRSRLYRSRFLKVYFQYCVSNTRWKTFDEIYKILRFTCVCTA